MYVHIKYRSKRSISVKCSLHVQILSSADSSSTFRIIREELTRRARK